MGDASEVVREVGVNDFRVAPEQQLFHLDHRLLGIAPGAVNARQVPIAKSYFGADGIAEE